MVSTRLRLLVLAVATPPQEASDLKGDVNRLGVCIMQ
jgi:hypothetical protein